MKNFMRPRIVLYATIGLIIGILSYFFFINQAQKEHNEFLPPPAFSLINELVPMTASTSSLSTGKTLYTNKTLGLSMEVPEEMTLYAQKAELQKYELGSDNEKVGQQYKYYEVIFSNKDNLGVSDYNPSIVIKAKEVPYFDINEWLEKDKTYGGYFPETTIIFERKKMFGEDVLYGFDDWLRNQSVPDEKRSSEYAFVIKNGFLYYITLYNLPEEERTAVWNSIKF